MRSATAASAGAREPVTRPLVGGQPCDRRPERIGVRGAQEARGAVAHERRRAALVDRDHRQSAGLRLEDDLAEGVGAAREEEDVGAGVGAGEVVALQPAEEGRVLAEAVAQRRLLGAAAREHEVQPGIERARAARNASASRSTPFSRVSRPA